MREKRVMIAAALLCLSCATAAMATDSSPASTGKAEAEAEAFAKMFGQGPQEEDVYRADRLLLTATGSLKPVHLAPSVASVITAEDIKGLGATTLDEVLEAVPGLHVEPSGSAYFASIWSIRGVHATINPQVLLLINGVPFTANYQGSRYLTYQMPVAMISRVEVVRGPGSALHGADAFSGTVNVITKDNFEIDGTQAGARYGSFDTSDLWAQHGGQYNGWDVAFGVESRKTGGRQGPRSSSGTTCMLSEQVPSPTPPDIWTPGASNWTATSTCAKGTGPSISTAPCRIPALAQEALRPSPMATMWTPSPCLSTCPIITTS